MCNRAQWFRLEADQAVLSVLTSYTLTRVLLSPATYGRKVYTRLVHPQLFTCAVLIWSSQGKSALPTYRLFAADVGVACSAGTHRHTQAYLKPSNEICNVVISFLSFKGGIERREGLGLYYHTPWREGQGHGSRKGLLKETRGGVANV